MIVKINGMTIPVANILYVQEANPTTKAFNLIIKDRLPESLSAESSTYQLNTEAEKTLNLDELRMELDNVLLTYHTT